MRDGISDLFEGRPRRETGSEHSQLVLARKLRARKLQL